MKEVFRKEIFRMRPLFRAMLFPILLSPMAFAQSPSSGADIHTASDLQVRAEKLQDEAAKAPNGQAGGTLEKYPPNDFTMLTCRTQNGVVEVHANYDDVFVVLDGDATLVIGGEIQNAKPTGGGETRGTSLVGGKSTRLAKGDIIHISYNVPHQLFIPKGHHFTYYVVKIKQN